MMFAPKRQDPAAGVNPHEESGVRIIPAEVSRLAQLAKAAAKTAAKASPEGPMSGVRQRRPVRGSDDAVCPKMLDAHMPLVHQIVTQISRRVPANVLRDDLLAAGVFGLVDSLRKNGGDGGETFEWYARMRIRGAVLDELRAQDWLTRRARDAVSAGGESDVAVLVGMDEVSQVEEQEFLAAEGMDPASTYELKQTFQILAKAVETLPDREAKIVRMYYLEGVRFKDIGAELGVSEPRVSQLHARALGRLKSIFDEKKMYRSSASRKACAEFSEESFPSPSWENTSHVNDPAAQVA